MTKISHLEHKDKAIRCCNCGREFEVSRQDLADPHRLVVKKERIAEKHTCRSRREIRRVSVWRHPANEDLQRYYENAVRRLMPA